MNNEGLETHNPFFNPAFIKENTPLPDKDTLQQMAKKIAMQEEELVNALKKRLGSNRTLEVAPGVSIDMDSTSLTYTSYVERLVPAIASEKRTIIFRHQPYVETRAVQQALSVDTPNTLFVQTHEDEKTRDELYRLSEKNTSVIELLGTYYVVNRYGEFAKVASLPLDIDDERESILTPFAGRKYVRSEMDIVEFKGLHEILSLIRAALKQS